MLFRGFTIVYLAIVIGACGSLGCAYGPHDAYAAFLDNPTQGHLDVLDRAGPEGARLIIGVLAMRSDWVLYVRGNVKYLDVSWIEIERQPIASGVPDVDLRHPSDFYGGHLLIRNPWVIHWAETQHGAEIIRE